MPKKESHLDYIDCLRGLAALMVMLFHGRQALWIGMTEFQNRHHAFDLTSLIAYLLLPFRMGSWGVQLFFVISGYCIHMSAAQNQTTAASLNWKKFFLKRFFRLYPAFTAAIAFTIFCTAMIGTPISWKMVFGNLFFLQGWLIDPLNYNDPLWSISVEVFLYLLYPVLMLVKEAFGLKMMMVGVLSIGILTNVLWTIGVTFVFTLVLSAWMPWAVGLWIAEKERRKELSPWKPNVQFILVVVSFMIAVYLHLRMPNRSGQEPFLAYAFGFLIYYGFCKGAADWRATALFSRFIVFLGLISYSLYLFHRPTQFLLRSVYENHVGLVPEHFGLFALGMVLSILIAWASYLFIETRFIKAGQQLLAKET